MRRRASGTAGKSILKMALPAVLLSVSCEPQLPSRPKEVPCVPQQVSSVAKADSDRTDGGVKKEKNCPEVECPKEKCPPADFIKEIIRVATDTNTVPEVREELVVLLAKLLEAQSFGFSISSIQG
ncbi:hypothetical protein JXA56_00600, partial [Candidatus Micrarchaeota archaeon]|nr:hypothetical protein [Candidatus Micrarchaeota archaeon]